VAKDIAEALGYAWTGSARIEHVPTKWRGVTSVVTPFGKQEMAVLSEQGVYYFLNRSDKPDAVPFQEWIAGEVLPSIRKTGGYSLNAPKTYAEALRALADETERVEALNSKLLEQKPKVDFYDTVIDAQGAFDFGVATKMLKYKNLGRNKLMEILRNKKILQSGGKTKNVPYQQFIDKGYFIVNENSFEDSFGNVHITYTTMVTQKGVDAIKKSIDKMVEEGELVLEEETSFFDLE